MINLKLFKKNHYQFKRNLNPMWKNLKIQNNRCQIRRNNKIIKNKTNNNYWKKNQKIKII